MKSRLLKIIGILSLVTFVVGCAHVAPRVVNLTPEVMPTNPSGIYSFSLMLDETNGREESANIVVGGSIYPMAMVKDSKDSRVFAFDYSIPAGGNRARYYFEILDKKGRISAKSEAYDLRLTNRYVVEMESNRAQPGQAISVLGKGFRSGDKISFGGNVLESRFISSKQLEFDVPALSGGVDYDVGLQTAAGLIKIGSFRIDYSELRSVPSRLVLLEGQSATIVFSIDREAPSGGVALDVQTDVENLVEYDLVSILEGTRSASFKVTGGAPGQGHLLVNAAAHNQLLIPIEVNTRVAEE